MTCHKPEAMSKGALVTALTTQEATLARKLVRQHLLHGLKSRRWELSRRQFLATVAESSREAGACMLDVLRFASLAAAHSIMTGADASKYKKVRQLMGPVVGRLQRSDRSSVRAKLSWSIRRWQSAGTHDTHTTLRFAHLCRQEALRTVHAKLAKPHGFFSRPDRIHHTLQARVADVRAEMIADVCAMPQLEDDKCFVLNGAHLSTGRDDTDERVLATPGWRGVNFGGWLLWEPGPANKSPLVRSLGEGSVPKDEWTLCERLVATHGRAQAEALMHEHRSTYVTKADFIAIKALGFNAVRIPFGYWAFCPREGEPFMGNCTEFLGAALDWGVSVGLSVVLCLHAGVGFQSCEGPCGRADGNWHPSSFDVAATVEIMRRLGKQYGNHAGLGGICVLNEPHGDLPTYKLNDYFKNAYHALRNECGLPVSVQIMLPVFQHDFKAFRNKYTEKKGYHNVVFDVHVYQVFGDPHAGWRKMSLAQHLRYATALRTSQHDAKCIANQGERVVVSEFSLAMPSWHKMYMISREEAALSDSEKLLLKRCFAFRQLCTFARLTEGFFFWCWHDDSGPEWDLQQNSARHWMPSFRNCDVAKCSYESAAEFKLAAAMIRQQRDRPLTSPQLQRLVGCTDSENDSAEGLQPENNSCDAGTTVQHAHALCMLSPPAGKGQKRGFDTVCSDASTDAGQSSDEGWECHSEADGVPEKNACTPRNVACKYSNSRHVEQTITV